MELLSILLGGGIVSFITFLIQRHDGNKEREGKILSALARLEEKIDAVDRKGDERNAVAARVRILRFMDEMSEGRRHSKDSFDQVLRDIDDYERYCLEHPTFKNNQTAATVEHIKHNFAERLERHDFA